jgi:hypothetical protein
MSFDGAKACFSENIQRSNELADPKLKAIMWNLSKGLLDLVTGMEERLDNLEAMIQNQSR